MPWGREESEWSELLHATAQFLAEQARLRRTTSYTELNAVLQQRTGAHGFDFDSDQGRAAMGALLGEVATVKLPEVGALVSSIVVYLRENDAGTGFFRLASSLGLLTPRPSGDQRLDFWANQVKATYDYYASR
ncbi:hypothetical protein GCM10011492_15610 [Flexivirga endophytica]|uniref:Uncharacterized protein n=1 Tax=Flexivirga endophytica TaxID=1849103 RepID=A0A916T2U2_9MICO|nr:hypothetical protein GCM10011492_15610 [Flexivirga endophytica]GHB54801.1 hypothetical protein GCM10008112_24930 [Flexivirga endophytica]